MRFTCYTDDIRDALKFVVKCADPKSNTPILSTVKIFADNGHVTFETTDFATAAQVVLPAKVEHSGDVCVNAKLFADIVLKAAENTITFSTEANQLQLRSGASKFELHTFDADEFPTMTFDSDNAVCVRAAVLKTLIRRTVFAVAKDNIRPVFQGVNITCDANSFNAAATNAQRIAIGKIPVHADEGSFNVVVPAAALKTLADILPTDIEEIVRITSTNRTMTFALDNVKLKTRLIDGEFPECNKVFEIVPTLEVVFNPIELRLALNRVNIIGKDSEWNCAVFHFNNGLVEIRTTSDALGTASETLDVGSFDGSLTIAFNINYLLDFLSALNVDHVRFKLADKTDPAIVAEDDSDFLYVITPVRI